MKKKDNTAKRKFDDFEIESFKDEDIVKGIQKHYPEDINSSITKFYLVKKYLITDKGILYSTHNFTRGYTATEQAEYKNASIKADDYNLKILCESAMPNPDAKKIKRWKEIQQQNLDTCFRIDCDRKQKRLTRLSERTTVVISFNDAYSLSDEDAKFLKENNISKPK